MLTQVLGGKNNQKPAIEIKSVKIENKDVYLLCTAGLVDGISDKKMEEMMVSATDSDGIIDKNLLNQIMDFSMENSGKRNSTAVLCQVFPDQSLWTSMIRSIDHD